MGGLPHRVRPHRGGAAGPVCAADTAESAGQGQRGRHGRRSCECRADARRTDRAPGDVLGSHSGAVGRRCTRQRGAGRMTARYGPPDAAHAPRYTGIRTFARCPHVTDLADVDVAVIGVPFDTATSRRPGARFGPEAIRSESIGLRPYHPPLDVDVFARLSVVDRGDVDVTPGNAERTAGQVAAALEPVVRAGVVPIVLGGDHSVVLGELRAQAAVHGPLALVLLDAHADTWDTYYGERYFHGTPFRRAVEEGLLRPERSVMAGMRGPLYSANDLAEAREMGFELIGGDELRSIGAADYAKRVRDRVGEAPVFFSFDMT